MIKNGDYREIKLDNGLVVALQNTPTKTISSNIRIHQGAFHENEDEKGLSHFTEHCLMNAGTERYSPLEVQRTLDNLGYHNAHTNLEMTYFDAMMLSEDIKNYLEVISQVVFHPRFDEKFVEQERQRVLREIEEIESGNGYKAKVMFGDALFRKHPRNIKIQGDKNIVEKASIEDLKRIYMRGFNANNSDIFIVGNLPDNVEDLVRENFGNVRSGENRRVEFPELEQLREKVILQGPPLNADDNQSEISMAMATIPENHKDNYALRTLYNILCTAPNSRLFTRLSSKEGLTYSVSGSFDTDCNANSCYIQTAVQEDKIERAISFIFEEIKKLRNGDIEKDEADKTKRRIRYNVASSLETNNGHFNPIYDMWKFGRTTDDFLNGYDAVTIEDLKRVAQKYLPQSREEGKYVLMIRRPK